MRRRPRFIAALVPVALVLAAVAQLALASDPPPAAQVTVTPVGGATSQTLALADLAAQQDVHDARYTLRSADGSTRTITVADGISLAALLRAATIDPESSYVKVSRPDGTSVLVLHDQVVGAGIDGQPVIWADTEGVHFLRPSIGSKDVNDGDLITIPSGTLALALRNGDPLGVRIDASATRMRPRRPVSFHAVLLDGGSAAGIGFSWLFLDGTKQRHGARVVHRFAAPGTYLVQVDVMQHGRLLDSAIQQIHITAAPERHHAASGNGSGGAGSGGADDGTGGSGGGAGAGAGIGGATAPQSTTPAPRARARRRATRHRIPRTPRAPRQPQGTLVSGTLLASASATPLPASASARDGQGGTPSDGPLRIPAGVWIAAGLAAILALGWALETRHTPPFWQP